MTQLLILLILLAACNGPPAVPTTTPTATLQIPEIVPDLWKVKLEADTPAEARAFLPASVEVLAVEPALGWVLVESKDIPTLDAVVEPVLRLSLIEPLEGKEEEPVPSEATESQEWNHHKIRAPDAWGRGYEGAGQLIAVIDSGLYPNAAEFPNARPCVSMIVNSPCQDGDHPHGTHVASLATGQVFGIAPAAELLPVKVLDATGNGNDWDVMAGIHLAVDQGADVVNLSLGGGYPSQGLCEAVEYAWTRGAIVFAASGNNRGDTPAWPARCPLAVAVGSTNILDHLSWYSNAFDEKDRSMALTAPGENVRAWVPGGPQAWSGTSMAAPHAAGEAAILRQKFSGDTPAETVRRMRAGAVDLGEAGPDRSFGSGRINILFALDGGVPTVVPGATKTHTPRPPTATSTVPAYPSPATPTPRLDEKAWLSLIMRDWINRMRTPTTAATPGPTATPGAQPRPICAVTVNRLVADTDADRWWVPVGLSYMNWLGRDSTALQAALINLPAGWWSMIIQSTSLERCRKWQEVYADLGYVVQAFGSLEAALEALGYDD